MKFAIGVLITLGVASILAVALGEFFPTNVPGGQAYYVEKMGASQFQILSSLGVFSPYRSFWFVAILFVLALSLTICSIRRFKSSLNLAFKKSFRSSEDEITKMKNGKSIRTKSTIDDIKNTLSQFGKKKYYRFHFEEKDGKTLVFGNHGGWSHIGFLALHFGMVVILFGGLIAALLGFSTYIWGGVGDILDVPERAYNVRVDDFEVQMNERGQVKDYLCTLTVLENGQESYTKVIEVNKPLRHRGINFYQSSYRADDRAIRTASLRVQKTEEGSEPQLVSIQMGDIEDLPDTPYKVRIADFAGNFRLDRGQVISIPGMNEFRNPAVKLDILDREGNLIKNGWVFSPRMAGFHSIIENYKIELIGFDRIFETGLNVTENPGSSLIWAGMILMTAGIFLVFYLNHKRIWGIIKVVDDNNTEVILGGVAHKKVTDFDDDIYSLQKQLKSK